MKRLLSLALLITLFYLPANNTAAQNSTLELTLADGHEMVIDGTSNIRDWDADVKTINATFKLADADFSDPSSLTADDFETMEFTIPVEDIESGSGRLTKNIHKYLKGDDHPNIIFTLSDVESVSTEDDEVMITARGVVNAAGVDNETTMNVEATLNADGTITFAGSHGLKMTDFDIDPPTAMLGSIRARDEFDIVYNLTFRGQ
ncbi:MAG: YceI family protein [Balneolaceae bacterium]